MTSFDMQPMRARFANQDQAESAIRKLASLRGDRFRLERAGGAFGSASEPAGASYTQSADDGGMMAAVSSEGALFSGDAVGTAWDAAGAGPDVGAGIAEFTLSANIPFEASEQARTVIVQAGGELY